MLHIFLDFDGTLADSSEGIHAAFTHACQEVGIQSPPLSEFRSFIGPPVQELTRQLMPGIGADILEKLRLKFRAEYDHGCYSRFQWYDGVLEGLQVLYAEEQASLSIVTNKPTRPTNDLLQSAGIARLFKYIVGVDYRVVNGLGSIFSCKKEAMLFALSLTGCPAEQAVYVGDTLSDQKACQESGVEFIAATYGFYSWQPQELDGITNVRSFGDAVDTLCNLLPCARR